MEDLHGVPELPSVSSNGQGEAASLDPRTLPTTRARQEHLRDFLRSLPAEQFDMTIFGQACGTPGCIAGWAAHLFGGQSFDGAGLRLGLTYPQQESLFWIDGAESSDPLWQASPAAAADVLDHLISTGEVDWSIARRTQASPMAALGPSTPGNSGTPTNTSTHTGDQPL